MSSTDVTLEATLLRTAGAWVDPETGERSSQPTGPGTAPLQVEPGMVIGRYTVLAHLGAGAMGVVYEAFDRDLDRRVAVKLLQRGSSDGLLAEAKAMARLAHAHVVAVYDVGTVRLQGEPRAFIAMEYVDGGTLGSWLSEAEPSIEDILEVFLAAGAGLAAAHRAGLVHRDFKPDNVLMTTSGEAKVTDFGLAYSTGSVLASDEESSMVQPMDAATSWSQTRTDSRDAATSSDSAAPTRPIPTNRGRPHFCGTPAYMAPELYQGKDATPCSDQFAFCVALWEALYRQRPFDGRSLMGLGLAICKGRRTPPPRDINLPRRISDVLDRGLANDPDRRFTDMDGLLAALRPPVPRRSARGALAIATVGVAAGLGLGWGLLTKEPAPSPDPCRDASMSVDAVWSRQARADLRCAIEASGGSSAPAAADHIIAELDGYATALASARMEACERRHEGRDASELGARRVACLDGREQALAGFVQATSTVEAEQVDLLMSAAAKLPALAACEDPERLLASIPPPDADQAVAVAVLRQELARLRTLRVSRAHGSVEAAARASTRAGELGYAPLVAEASHVLGQAQLADDRLQDATVSLRTAYVTALRIGHDEVAAAAAADLLFIVGVERGDSEAGRRWGEHGLALAHRGGHVRRRADVLAALATLERGSGRHKQSIAHSREVVELLEAELGPDHLDTGRAYGNYGVALGGAGDMAAALPWLERCAGIYETKYGEHHVRLAPLYSNLGTVRVAVSQLEQARRDLDRALTIHELNGSSAKDIGYVRAGLADLAARQGDHATAVDHREFILTAYREYFGDLHPTVAGAELSLALAYLAAGEPAKGIPHTAAVSKATGELGAESPPGLAPRARMAAGALSIASGDAMGASELELGWEELQTARPGATLGVELETWLAAHPEVDPRPG